MSMCIGISMPAALRLTTDCVPLQESHIPESKAEGAERPEPREVKYKLETIKLK